MNVIAILILVLLGFALYYLKSNKKPPSYPPYKKPPSTSPKQKKIVRTEELFKENFDKYGLSEHWNFFQSYLKGEILIEPKSIAEEQLAVGQSKIGGQPDLPNYIEWFKEDNGSPFSFIAQINLSETVPFDQFKTLPTHGILYFFYSAEQEAAGFDIKDKDKFKVFYFDGKIEELERKDFPGDLPDYSRYKPCELHFQSSVNLPGWEHPYASERLTEEETDAYLEAVQNIDFAEGGNKLLGYSDNIQEAMELECQLVTNGLYCGNSTGYNDPRAKELEKGAAEWTLLLQVDSTDESGMMWGDVGRIYYWIKNDDLKNRNFDNCWLILQCF